MNRSPYGTKARIRAYLAERDGAHCHYCRKPLTLSSSTIDHVIPKALGGPRWEFANMRLACHRCNKAKGAQPPHVFYALSMSGLVA